MTSVCFLRWLSTNVLQSLVTLCTYTCAVNNRSRVWTRSSDVLLLLLKSNRKLVTSHKILISLGIMFSIHGSPSIIVKTGETSFCLYWNASKQHPTPPQPNSQNILFLLFLLPVQVRGHLWSRGMWNSENLVNAIYQEGTLWQIW